MRKRDARKYWAKHVAQWSTSGLTRLEYAAKHGVGASSLKNWKWQLRVEAKQAARAPRFLEVLNVEPPKHSDTFEVVLVDGVTVRVPTSFDVSALSRLLDVVSGLR